MIVPAISQPKGVLQHRLSATDVAGTALPMLTRMEGARLSALFLLRVLQAGVPSSMRAREEELIPTIRLLGALAHANLAGAEARKQVWAEAAGLSFSPLDESFTRQWMTAEADSLVSNSGEKIVESLASRPRPLVIKIPNEARPGALRTYATIDQLLKDSIRDVLSVIIDSTPEFRASASDDRDSPRAELLGDPDAAAEAAVAVLTTGQSAFSRLVLHQSRGPASGSQEVASHLERWVAYVPLETEIGASFRIDFSQPLPLAGDEGEPKDFVKAVGQTFLEYPLALRDAASVHTEVRLDDLALRLGLRRFVISRSERSFRFGRKFEYRLRRDRRRSPKTWIERRQVAEIELIERKPAAEPQRWRSWVHIDQLEVLNEQELTLYAERGVGPAPRMSVSVPINLTHWIFGAYVFAAIFFGASASFVAGAWAAAALNSSPLYHPEVVFALSALGVSLSLWMTSGQERRPLVHKKLLLARWVFFGGMLLLAIAPAFFGVWWCIRHL